MTKLTFEEKLAELDKLLVELKQKEIEIEKLKKNNKEEHDNATKN